ncbi:MAG: hypothetical protein MZV64_18820 [Ignavibacteriales bacterium]|nr:hypothetical protein [Ignavibacteriales bacterium]
MGGQLRGRPPRCAATRPSVNSPFRKWPDIECRPDALPELLADLGMDAFVAEDDELLAGRDDEEEDAVAVLRSGSCPGGRRRARPPRRTLPQKNAGHRDPDLAGGRRARPRRWPP